MKELHRKKLENDYKKRLQIIYYSSLGHCNKDISELLVCTVETVRKWRSRWQKVAHTIMGLEKDHNQEKISDIKLSAKHIGGALYKKSIEYCQSIKNFV